VPWCQAQRSWRSRGIVEAEYDGEEFGLERMKQSLQHATARSAHGLCLDVLQAIQSFTQSPPTHNDVTALALVRNAG
jgi:serine phosphatase RsbU (regulator of sigma subunit)